MHFCTTSTLYVMRRNQHAYVYFEGRTKDLGVLPGGDSTWGYGIINFGQTVGGAVKPLSQFLMQTATSQATRRRSGNLRRSRRISLPQSASLAPANAERNGER
jgi:hypothetical protein